MSLDLIEHNVAGLTPVNSLTKRNGARDGNIGWEKGREGAERSKGLSARLAGSQHCRRRVKPKALSDSVCKFFLWPHTPMESTPCVVTNLQRSGFSSTGPVPGSSAFLGLNINKGHSQLYYRGSLGGSHLAHKLSCENNITFTSLSSLGRGCSIELKTLKRMN